MVSSKFNNSYIIFRAIAVAFLFIGDIIGLWFSFFSGLYPKLPFIIITFVIFCIQLCFIFSILFLEKIFIDKSHIVVSSIFGRTKKNLLLSDIQKWKEDIISSENKDNKELTLYFSNYKYKIFAKKYANYEELKFTLTRDKQRDVSYDDSKQNKNQYLTGIFFILLGLGFIAYSLYNHNKKIFVNDHSLVRLKGTLNSSPEISTSKNGSHSTIYLAEYPQFNFNVSGEALLAMNNEEYINLKKNDTIFLTIQRMEYEKKIAHSISMNFFDKTIDYSFIDVYGIDNATKQYLSVNNYNKSLNQHKYYQEILELIAGAILISIGLWKFRGNRFYISVINKK